MKRVQRSPIDLIIPETAGQFYVYILWRPNGQPFYVGKGQGYRIGNHEQEARRNHNCHKCYVIRKIWREGGEVGREIVYRTNSELLAIQMEARLIQRFGVRLVNILPSDPRLRPLVKQPRAQPDASAQRSRAHEMLRILDRDLGRAWRRGDERAEARILAEIDAYRDFLFPPTQEGFDF